MLPDGKPRESKHKHRKSYHISAKIYHCIRIQRLFHVIGYPAMKVACIIA
jgi:hypothetical protein